MNNTLQTILERAEHRYEEDGECSGFLLTLARQATDDLQLTALTLWLKDSGSFTVVASTDTTPDEQPASEFGTGRVTVLPLSPAGQQLQTAVPVAEDVQLIVRADEGDVPVDHNVLLELSDIFADLHRRRMLDEFVVRFRTEASVQILIAQLHSGLNSRVVANTIATDAAPVLQASRIAVGQRRGRHWKIVATTGVSQPNERSDAVRGLASAIESGSSGQFTSKGHEQHRFVHPLHADNEWTNAEWAIVIDSDEPLSRNVQTERFLQHASMALANSTASERNTPGSILRRITRPRRLAIVLATGALAAALMLPQTELRIEAYGELVPTQRNFVFAPDDGTITELNVEDGSSVERAETLCVLTNEELNVQQEAIAGELAAANARLAAIDALRTGNRADATEARLLSAEQAELEVQVRSLEKQWTILTDRLNLLKINARNHGKVYGDRLRQMLYQRPVTRGQYLFEVADPSGGWQLELRVPEADARYVLAASQEPDEMPNVTFSLKTSPETIRQTSLVALGASTDVDHNGELSTLAIADLADVELNTERPGAGVVARIHCGKRSIGFVWFRQVVEFVQRHTWL